MIWAHRLFDRIDALLDRIDAIGQRIPATAAFPLAGLYLASLALWATGFQAEQPALILVFAPAWAPGLFHRRAPHAAAIAPWTSAVARP